MRSTSTWGRRRKRQVGSRSNIHPLLTRGAGSPTRGNLFPCRRAMGNARPPQFCQQRRRLVRDHAGGRSPGHAGRFRIYPKTSKRSPRTIRLLTHRPSPAYPCHRRVFQNLRSATVRRSPPPRRVSILAAQSIFGRTGLLCLRVQLSKLRGPGSDRYVSFHHFDARH